MKWWMDRRKTGVVMVRSKGKQLNKTKTEHWHWDKREVTERHKTLKGGSERWMEHRFKRVNDSRRRWREEEGVSPVQPPHIFPRKGYNLHKPTKGQERSTRCQLHLGSQHFFFSSFSFCLSLCWSVSVYPFVSIYFDGTSSNHCGFKVRRCLCVLFQGHVSFSNLGFCSMCLAGSGVPLLPQCLVSRSSLWPVLK